MICPNCGFENEENAVFCSQCGYDIKSGNEMENLINNDPILNVLNGQYIRLGIAKYVFGFLFAFSFLTMYFTLEYNLPDGLGIFGMLLFVVSLICFIIFSVLRSVKAKKIRKELRKHNIQM